MGCQGKDTQVDEQVLPQRGQRMNPSWARKVVPQFEQ